MSQPVVHGPAYSTYTRTVRLALEEKGAGYKLDEVDIRCGAGQDPAHLARQPFGKVLRLQP
jgi:glutathione S-transferase